TAVGVAGIDDIKFEGSESEISDDNPFGKAEGKQRQFAGGIVWKTLFKNAYLQTIFSNSIGDNHITNRDLRTDSLKFSDDSFESEFTLKSEFFYQLDTRNNLSIGLSGKYIKYKNNV